MEALDSGSLELDCELLAWIEVFRPAFGFERAGELHVALLILAFPWLFGMLVALWIALWIEQRIADRTRLP